MITEGSSAERRARDRVWMILGSDGRHVLLGRNSDPTDAELQRASEAIVAQGQSGWLAIREGNYYDARAKVTLLRVRSLTPAEGDWNTAAEAFEAIRQTSLASLPS